MTATQAKTRECEHCGERFAGAGVRVRKGEWVGSVCCSQACARDLKRPAGDRINEHRWESQQLGFSALD